MPRISSGMENKMKKVISLLVALLCIMTLVGCQKSEPDSSHTVVPVVTLDNTDSIETEEETSEVSKTGKKINPYPASLDLNNLQDAEFSVSFNSGDIYDDAGTLMIDVNVYEGEYFDVVELNQLEIGDIIVFAGKEVLVEKSENIDGVIKVNGGYAAGGHDLEGVGGGIYVENKGDEPSALINLGKVSLKVEQEFELVDNSDADGQKIYFAGDLFDLMETNRSFSEFSTRARVANGNLISIICE